ncbi:hypothetical protein [Deefgea rivuli]|uniref:hypothetical protein n=1 Tax=Deefgea rivuli TaxID=400948 RepID=UPI00146FB30D|nr:hypothetical protein [Deefgea rivuli]
MPRGTYFSLLRQRKVGKRKATLHLRPTSSDSLAADNRGGCAQNSFGLNNKSIGLAQTLIAKTPPRFSFARLDTRDF